MNKTILASLLVLSPCVIAAQSAKAPELGSLAAGSAPLATNTRVDLARLTASDGAYYDGLGISVSVSGDGNTVVGGASCAHYDNGCGDAVGEAYVFAKPLGGWANGTERSKLSASDSGGQMGSAVAILGDTVVLGAPNAAIGSNVRQGAVYIFVKPTTGWANMTETAKLTAADGTMDDYLGSSVTMVGNTVVVGGAHRAYVFSKPKNGWRTTSQYTAKLSPSDPGFGPLGKVAMTSDTVVVGAPTADIGSNSSQGATYVFVKPATGWANMSETAKMTASDGTVADNLGWFVAIGGNTVVAGAPIKPYNGRKSEMGAAYVFVKPAKGWINTTETAKLIAGQGIAFEEMGHGVAISSRGDKILAAANSGVYKFVRPAAGWKSTAWYQSKATAANGDSFLDSIACTGGTETVVSGSAYATVGNNQYQGAVYVFALPTLKTFSPPNGPVGTSVTITGSNLAQTNSVTFGGVSATNLTADDDNTVTVIVPPEAITGIVKITTPSGMTSSKDAYTVIP